MAALSIYNVGLDTLSAWTTATYEWALLTAGSFDADAATVTAVLAGAPVEVSGAVTGYARVAAGTKVRTVDNTLDQITYTAENPSFGALTGTPETVTAVLLYRFVTNDADSIPVGFAAVTATLTDAINPFTFTITDGIVAYVDLAA